jgi:hypothetical protein
MENMNAGNRRLQPDDADLSAVAGESAAYACADANAGARAYVGTCDALALQVHWRGDPAGSPYLWDTATPQNYVESPTISAIMISAQPYGYCWFFSILQPL